MAAAVAVQARRPGSGRHPHAGASLGNIWTGVNVGATVRLGQDLSVDFGVLSVSWKF